MSFKAAFRKKKSNLLNVGTESWQKYINAQAPQGTHYQFDGKSHYFLTPNDDASLELKVKVHIPEDLKEIKIRNANELTELLYRTQRTVEVEVPEFLYDGKPVKIEQIKKSFDSKIVSKKGKFFISPKPFREPFEIPIEINNEIYNFEIKQVPFPSLEEVRFESSEDGMIFIKIAYNEKIHRMDFSLTYNFKKAKNISEIYHKKKLLEDISKGNIKIFDKDSKILTEDQSEDLKHLIFFYSKLYEIEKKLNIQFNPKEKIKPEDILNTYKTYISFVKNEYYYNEHKHDFFEITLKDEADFSSYEELAMLGYNEVTISILDQSIQMAEQFVFKCTELNENNKKINKKGETLKFNVKDNRIRYNKLFIKIPENPDMNEISEKLKDAINIEGVEKIL